MVALCLGGGVFGISLGNHVTQSGFYDDGSQSVHASVIADKAYGRDTSGHIIGSTQRPRARPSTTRTSRRRSLDNLAGRERPPRRDPALDRLPQEPRR
jgi:RND superfamily putative drug exporter